jgi:hypothetical protein
MKIVIYKVGETYYATNEANYNAKIQNARAVHKMDDFNSAQEIQDYFCEHLGSKPEDFIVIE